MFHGLGFLSLGRRANNWKYLKVKYEILYRNVQEEVNPLASVVAQHQIAPASLSKFKEAHGSN